MKKIIAAYLKGFFKIKNTLDVFLFGILFFCFGNIDIFVLCKLK